MDLAEVQELIDTKPEELIKDALMEKSASEPVPNDEEEDMEEAVTDNKLTLDNLADGFQLFKTAFDFFYDMGPSMTWALKLKHTVDEHWYHIETREIKNQKHQTNFYVFA